ncbi:MAG: LOG family protein [Planctomycetota bacterium]|nr:LOG family protein [Planctomycetota bacterium]
MPDAPLPLSPEHFAVLEGVARSAMGGDVDPSALRATIEAMEAAVGALTDRSETHQIRLVRTAMREVRSAFRIFNRYAGVRKVAIFGSARTPTDHPDYKAALEFGHLLSAAGWMAITGGGEGIMRAGLEGPTRDRSFGLVIHLPFESKANAVIAGDHKAIRFRYFFTRKVAFLSHADAIAAFPGGFGTLDELFEALTLIQTGRGTIVPLVLVEGAGPDGKPRGWWRDAERWIRRRLLDEGWISPEDLSLFERASSPQDAAERIAKFYRVFHSSRYVGDRLVIRLQSAVAPEAVESLQARFAPLLSRGRLRTSEALPEEKGEHPDLPRLVFAHTRRDYGMVRQLIHAINKLPVRVAAFLCCATLIACGTGESVRERPSASRSPVTSPAAPGQHSGLELVRITLPCSPATLAPYLSALRAPDGLEPSARSRLQRNGIAIGVLNERELLAMVDAVGGVLQESRTWLGQGAQWMPLVRQPADPFPRLFVDGRLLAGGRGHLECVTRAWAIEESTGESIDTQFAVMAIAPATRRPLSTSAPQLRNPDQGRLLPGTSGFFTIHRGELAIVAPWGTGSVDPARGPSDGEGPSIPTPGDALLTTRFGTKGASTILLLVPVGLRDLQSSHLSP